MLPSWRRFADHHPYLVEAAFLVLLCAATGRQYIQGELGWWPGFAIAVAACAALRWRRDRPGPVVAVTAVAAGLPGGFGYQLSPLLMLPLIVALYELAVRAPRRTAYAYGLGAVAVVVLPALLSGRNDESWKVNTVGAAFWIALPVVQGWAVRARRAYLEAVRTRAELAERGREQEARHRVSEERVRIARELHDVVAHHMALANAQAGTAAHLARSHPEQAEAILTELTRTTSSALRELRASVGLLRRTDEDGDPLEPAPGLAGLPELVAAFGAAGLDVSVVTEGEPRPLSPGVDLTAFRIVQEALTNVAKHAAVGAAQVRLAYTHDQLVLTVSNEGPAGAGPARDAAVGYGLTGMRERAASADGRLRAGRRPEGGFAVTAELPIHR
ncbi:sensor histidine kinase [Actinacidiphila alni]|uniref:sensor histidine kinase n=1 Tax=Actinacidiphila alni TaxID=380248 RepID=UPI0033F48366